MGRSSIAFSTFLRATSLFSIARLLSTRVVVLTADSPIVFNMAIPPLFSTNVIAVPGDFALSAIPVPASPFLSIQPYG
jgi:hypothetical protein